MYESFYGGKTGFSFIIAKSFPFEKDMIAAFQQGPEYTEVHFDEYVIIDTENKNLKENGRLYRRGYDYTNDMGGAIFVGCISGPAGKAPLLMFEQTIEDVQEIIANAEEVPEKDKRSGEGSFTLDSTNFVPGKEVSDEGDALYNDEIKWVYCSVRNPDADDTIAHIGFKVPYLVLDFTTESTSAYEQPTIESIPTEDGLDHPFYEHWHIKIPRGIQGDSLYNLRSILPTGEEQIKIISEDGQVLDYDLTNDVKYQRNIFVYDKWVYDNTLEGEVLETYYLGPGFEYVEETIINESNYHLLIRYNESKMAEYDDAGLVVNYQDKKWIDLGAVKDQSGLLIGFNVKPSEIDAAGYDSDLNSGCIEYLNANYPYGAGKDLNGNIVNDLVLAKVVSVGESDTDKENKRFFAFDYNRNVWYFITDLNITGQSMNLVAAENDPSIDAKKIQVIDQGIWWILEED